MSLQTYSSLLSHKFKSINLIELAESHGTPLFVFSESVILENVSNFVTAYSFSGFDCEIFYASKANSNLSILKIIKETGIGIEVSSIGELLKAKHIGFDPNKIILNGPAKSAEEIRLAISFDILSINVDSLVELDRISDIAGCENKKASVCLRIAPGVMCGTKKGLESGSAESKFGMEISDLNEIVRKASFYKKSIIFRGLHLHSGSQIPSKNAFVEGLNYILETTNTFKKLFSKDLIINLGGGYPVNYFNLDRGGSHFISNDVSSLFKTNLSVKEIADVTIGNIFKNCQEDNQLLSDFNTVKFVFEPGRSIVGNSAILIARIENLKTRSENKNKWLFIDAGFNILLETFDYKWFFDLISLSRINEEHDTAFRVAGPLCDGGDVFFDHNDTLGLPKLRMLPEGTTNQDFVTFLDVGAYTLEQMIQYNGRFRAAAILVRKNGEVVMIRKRDTLKDLIAQDCLV